MPILIFFYFFTLICVNKIFTFETSKNHLCIQNILIKGNNGKPRIFRSILIIKDFYLDNRLSKVPSKLHHSKPNQCKIAFSLFQSF